MNRQTPIFDVKFAQSQAEVQCAQRLRYQVFIKEMGGDGPMVDHDAGLEADQFDDLAQHLLLLDRTRPVDDQVVGAYRLMDRAAADKAGGFYTAQEFDLTPLLSSGRKLLELGRSCLHPSYRGGMAMHLIWQALGDHVHGQGAEVLFGAASFVGTDLTKLAQPLSLLHHAHLAPENLRPTARETDFTPSPADEIDRKAAILDTPSLIKAYIRLGGTVGQGVYRDQAFQTTDICMVLDTAMLSDRKRALFSDNRSKPL